MIRRPSLLALTAAVAAAAAVANGVSAASPDTADVAGGGAPAQTRLGAAIGGEMNARDRAVAERKRALDLREQATRAAEARLKADLDARQQADAAPAAEPTRSAGRMEQERDQYDDLARIYQAMKPAQAAVVLEQLDLDVQMKVAQKMRERSAAMILGQMTPKGAAKLSMALARRYPVSSPPPGARNTAARP
ncbi:MotE family protein [Sphingomonas sp. ac-8]|uniref:MotE family protein n=1 Tax=Sphingomonas sp. ac-8 TaxID=3242977 RepID=UPI003A7F75CE